MAKLCLGCMKLKENSPVCEHCGYNENVPNYSHQLPMGTVLQGRYTVGKVLGQGGFGITYIGWDNFLDVPVAIKEFYPSSFVNRDCSVTLNVTCNGEQAESLFAYNRERFLREAKILAKLQNIPGIVKVQNLFTENNTAYIVMEYVKGIDLKHYIRMQGRVLTPQETFSVLRPIMYALQKVHEADLVHRDISPDNIMILPDGSAKLLDFGAAREVEHAEVDKELPQSTEAILKHGFAPLEQYRRRGNLGPWTDVYALCATIFYCLTGRVPNSATERILEDDNVNWRQIPGLNKQQIAALEQGMALMPKQRTRSVRDLWDGLFGQSRSSFTQQAAPEPPKPDPAEEQKRQREMEEQRLRQEQERLKQEQERLKQEQLEQKRQEAERRAQEKLEKQRQEAEQREQQRLRQQQLQEEKRQQKLRQEQEKRQQQELQRQQKLEEKQRRQQNQEKKAFGKVLIPILAVICVMLTVFILSYQNDRNEKQLQEPQISPETTSSSAPTEEAPLTWMNGSMGVPETTTSPMPTEEAPVWVNNVLMADTDFNKDNQDFWNNKYTGWGYEITNYFSERPVFNSDIPRKRVTDVFFLNSLENAPEDSWDVSADQNNSVQAWVVKNLKGSYDLYIAANGGINGAEACRVLFYGYTNLTSINFNNSFFTEYAEDMYGMFGYCTKLTSLDLSSFNTSNVTNMGNMFDDCDNLVSLDLSSFDTSNVTSMSSMFSSCGKLSSLDVSHFNTSNVQDMSYMFSYLYSMPSFDISNFDTSNVQYMNGMFSGCQNEKFTSLDISNFDTSNVVSMSHMFSNCLWLKSLDLSNFDTSKVTNMSGMFNYCRRLTSLNLSSFDTSNVTDMHSMFEMCSLLPVLEISHFNTAKVTNMSRMFHSCGYLKEMDITQCDVSSVTINTDMFDGCDKLPFEHKMIGGEHVW